MRKHLSIQIFFLCALMAVAQQPPKDSKPASTASALPADFSGWHKGVANKESVPIQKVSAMQEYGLNSSESFGYERGDRKVSITALRFADATGAYGAFTYFRTPDMAAEKLCDQGASQGNHVIFFCSNVFVDVQLDKVTAMTPAELRSLAAAIPRVSGNLAELPKLPLHLSQQAQKNVKYIAGPAGLDSLNETVKSSLVDFSLSPEVVVAKEPTLDGDATVILVQYPTESIAKVQVAKMVEWARANKPKAAGQAAQPATDTLADRFATRRSGPLVGIVTGKITEGDARKILEDINYDAEVTWNEKAPNAKDNAANLMVQVIYLCFIVVGFAFVISLAFGGFRLFLKKYYPGRFVDRPEDVEFIKLNLRE